MADVPRMRSVKQCADYFRKQDSETHIQEYFLRKKIQEGFIPIVKTGRKQLINLDWLILHLNNLSLQIDSTNMQQSEFKDKNGE